jgi:hypothetical protein
LLSPLTPGNDGKRRFSIRAGPGETTLVKKPKEPKTRTDPGESEVVM